MCQMLSGREASDRESGGVQAFGCTEGFYVDNSCSSDADHTWRSISDLFPDEPSERRGEF